MSVLRYLLPAMAAAAGSAAQSCGGTSTISNAAAATALSNACGSRTFSGDIVIATGVTEPIALDGITGISGSLIANNVTQMTGLSADAITTIGDTFELESLIILATLNFPALNKVDTIMWQTLPALQGLSFSTNGVQEANTVTIDDTQLNTLDGINLMSAETISIQNNRYLNSVNMQLGNVSTSLELSANGNMLVAEFPNLIWANNITLRNVSSVSIPSLAAVNGSAGFYGDGFQSLSAPNLTMVGQDLSIDNCNSLTNLSMPVLTTIGGGFQIANNTDLTSISGFPKVASVGGAVDFEGAFTTVQLPALSNVRGAFNVQSSKDITSSCNHFEPLSQNNGPIQGAFTCQGGQTPGGVGSLPDGTSSGSGSSTSQGAAHPLLIPGATGLLGVFAAIFGLL